MELHVQTALGYKTAKAAFPARRPQRPGGLARRLIHNDFTKLEKLGQTSFQVKENLRAGKPLRMNPGYQVIESRPALHKLARALRRADAVGVDLEADSMYHFKERVCLIQMASAEVVAIVDPLKIKDLGVLKSFFADPAVTKILHGADYDIRSLYRDFGIRVNSLFDTEIACRVIVKPGLRQNEIYRDGGCRWTFPS